MGLKWVEGVDKGVEVGGEGVERAEKDLRGFKGVKGRGRVLKVVEG